jgi:putative transposase
MEDRFYILTYHVKHSYDLESIFEKAKKVADYAVKNKDNRKVLTSKYVKDIGLHSTLSNQLLRKYGRGTIQRAKNIILVVPNQSLRYKDETVFLTPLKLSFRWNCGRPFVKICQVEVSREKFMINVAFSEPPLVETNNIISLDLNCGFGRHVINAIDHTNNKAINLGKNGPHIRHKYFKLRQKFQKQNDKKKLCQVSGKEKRRMRDLDHKLSHFVVDYAHTNNLTIVMEDLKGIRKRSSNELKRQRVRRKKLPSKPKYHRKLPKPLVTWGNGSKTKNRLVNTWSFFRLQTFITYKAKALGIPTFKVKPHYTSQQCSYCGRLGNRDRGNFSCKNKKCEKYGQKRNSDINAAFNVGKRYLGLH